MFWISGVENINVDNIYYFLIWFFNAFQTGSKKMDELILNLWGQIKRFQYYLLIFVLFIFKP